MVIVNISEPLRTGGWLSVLEKLSIFEILGENFKMLL